VEAIRVVQTGARLHTLVLVRHGESEWNQRNLFTGQRDPDLTEKGVIEARVAGRLLKYEGLTFDLAFTSKLKRAEHTLDIMLAEINQSDLEIQRDVALNERKYGDLSGLNSRQVGRRQSLGVAPQL
jgi:2,3-bisphosphoglycerate-dependent phosphoglycerate mutase